MRGEREETLGGVQETGGEEEGEREVIKGEKGRVGGRIGRHRREERREGGCEKESKREETLGRCTIERESGGLEGRRGRE